MYLGAFVDKEQNKAFKRFNICIMFEKLDFLRFLYSDE